MTEDQLRLSYIGALKKHWRSSLDRSGPTPELIDDLCDIAAKHAVDHAKVVTARRELREQAAAPLPASHSERVTADPSAPLVVAADLPVALQADLATMPPPATATSSHRTRTRPRRAE